MKTLLNTVKIMNKIIDIKSKNIYNLNLGEMVQNTFALHFFNEYYLMFTECAVKANSAFPNHYILWCMTTLKTFKINLTL